MAKVESGVNWQIAIELSKCKALNKDQSAPQGLEENIFQLSTLFATLNLWMSSTKLIGVWK